MMKTGGHISQCVLSPLGGDKSHTLLKDKLVSGDRLKTMEINLEFDLDLVFVTSVLSVGYPRQQRALWIPSQHHVV